MATIKLCENFDVHCGKNSEKCIEKWKHQMKIKHLQSLKITYYTRTQVIIAPLG